ncbi:MAG: nucleotidyl transferase AbiEii/AbiGii toxin family protein [Nitrospirae bacterium]|nr:nucleotidyl transferase AbiEii/AbiGii toxin family protein [Nitrospirota bacterium]
MPRKEILSPLQKKVLSVLSSIEESRAFHITGGTALGAFYLGHRLSEDIDIFTSDEPLISILAEKIKASLRTAGIQVAEIRNFRSFWEAVLTQNNESIKIQIGYDSPFTLSDFVEKQGLKIHSLQDIAAGKLLALYGRAEERDFIDIYLLARDGRLSLEEMIDLARKKDPGLDEYYLAVAFEQSEKLPDDPAKLKVSLLSQVDPKEVKAFFASKAVALLKKRRGG